MEEVNACEDELNSCNVVVGYKRCGVVAGNCQFEEDGGVDVCAKFSVVSLVASTH